MGSNTVTIRRPHSLQRSARNRPDRHRRRSSNLKFRSETTVQHRELADNSDQQRRDTFTDWLRQRRQSERRPPANGQQPHGISPSIAVH